MTIDEAIEKCEQDHLQIAEWLEELKAYIENSNKKNLIIYKDEKSMNIQPTIEYIKSTPRRPLNRIYCPECNRILCPAMDKCICGQIIKWEGSNK